VLWNLVAPGYGPLQLGASAKAGVPFSDILALNPEVAIDLNAQGAMFQDRTGGSATLPSSVGDPVGSLRNFGTKGGWLTAPSDAARPILRAAGLLRYLETDSSNDVLVGALAALRAVAGWTLVAGLRNTGSTAATRSPVAVLTGAGMSRANISFTAATGLLQVLGRRTDADGSNFANGLAHANVDIVATGIGDYTNTDAINRANGVQEASNTSWLTAGVSDNTGGDVTLGAVSSGGNNPFGGRIYSALVFPSVLGPSDLALAELWTAQQAGIVL